MSVAIESPGPEDPLINHHNIVSPEYQFGDFIVHPDASLEDIKGEMLYLCNFVGGRRTEKDRLYLREVLGGMANGACRQGRLEEVADSLEQGLTVYMTTWASRPTASVFTPAITTAVSNNHVAAEYLWRMLGTSDFRDDEAWFPDFKDEYIWLARQATRFAGYPVELQIETIVCNRFRVLPALPKFDDIIK